MAVRVVGAAMSGHLSWGAFDYSECVKT